jgi:hypothetical protein
VTRAAGSQSSGILFDDFDNGQVIKAFTMEMDVRVGDGTAQPADGFSICYVRAGDPCIAALQGGTVGGFATGFGGELNLPEEGSQTGISVGFDCWDSDQGDPIGSKDPIALEYPRGRCGRQVRADAHRQWLCHRSHVFADWAN